MERHVARLEARIHELEQTEPQARASGPSHQGLQPRRSMYHEWGVDIEPASPTLPEGRGQTRTRNPALGEVESVISPDPKIEPHVATIRLL